MQILTANTQPGGLALVTGAAGGIGSELCRKLHRNGWRLALAGRSAASLEALSLELPGARSFVCDVTDSAQVKAMVSRVIEEMGPPTAAAHCVGSILLKAAHQLRDDEWRETFKINVDSAFYLMRSLTQAWLAQGVIGNLVFCSSAAAKIGLANHEAISAAKAALEGLVRASAATYAARGIRVNAVAPGLVGTHLSSRITTSEAALKASLTLHPMRKIGQPSQIASAIAWLMDPEQAWVTGQIIGVDGGLAALKTLA
jgi:3-oxoacyl-[acyl-carrier protein] reductase